ncbi:esterase/lipase family protein [Cardinium endosymbiont of Nabis limbatus]|uniref:esterase/lipase family protein n=1 Tax=Cardinium endosymbiont of Nabis limbatus TaxID=3066217 RepID=UPI003AF3AD98
MSYVFYISRLVLFCLLFVPTFSQAKNQNDKLIVLFHGLGNKVSSFSTMEQGLKKALPAYAIIAPTSVEGMKSVELSIKQQAKMVYRELSKKVKDLASKSILLVGHSQGGLRAYSFLKQYGHLLRIRGLVTLATPWEGAPGARVDPAVLSQHLTDSVVDDIRMLAVGLGYAENELEKQLMVNVENNQSVCLFPGGKDLMPGSDFLAEVKKNLFDEKVPILAIGGGQGNFEALLPKGSGHCFKALNALYTFFVVGEAYPNNSYHDMQVPLFSQHAFGILSESKKSKKNFTRFFIKDAFHSAYVWNIPVPKSKAILAHPKALRSVIKFAKRRLK